MIVAVDFDGTIVKDAFPNIGEINADTVNYLNYLSKKGAKLILWTCRSGELLEQAVEVCKKIGLNFEAINDNLPEIVAKYGNNSRKIFADIYLDDRGFIPKEAYFENYEKEQMQKEFDSIPEFVV